MKNKIKILIIEDEAPAASLIRRYLQVYAHIDIIAECKDGFEGVKAIQMHKPDLIFLDIQMPKITGFEMLELIDEKPHIIFTTAYDEYAIKAFEMNAVDYLMKPFSKERFLNALSKALQRITENTKPDNTVLEKVSENVQEKGYLERIIVKDNSVLTIIPLSDVSHIEAYGDYVLVHSKSEKHLKSKTMHYYEQTLDPRQFVRIHRSYIVNIEYVEHIELWEKDTYKLRLNNGENLRASRAGYKKLKELF